MIGYLDDVDIEIVVVVGGIAAEVVPGDGGHGAHGARPRGGRRQWRGWS